MSAASHVHYGAQYQVNKDLVTGKTSFDFQIWKQCPQIKLYNIKTDTSTVAKAKASRAYNLSVAGKACFADTNCRGLQLDGRSAKATKIWTCGQDSTVKVARNKRVTFSWPSGNTHVLPVMHT